MTRNAPILLVEDDENDIYLVRRALEKSGLPNAVFLARNGEEAIQFLQNAANGTDPQLYPVPGLVLLDLKMPDLDGFGLLTWVQSRGELSRMPIVVLIASPHQADLEKAHHFGVTDYQLKPSRFQDLVRLVHEIYARWLDQGPQ